MLLAILLAVPLALAASIPPRDDTHDSHHVNKRLPSNWYHSRDHPVHSLFKRAVGDGTDYAPVGSPAWSSQFPTATFDVAQLPQAWVDSLNAAVAAGKIPSIPQTTNTPGVNPVYPTGTDPHSSEVCSSTYKCRDPTDLWDAPEGYFGTGFDDGPQPATTKLVQFLDQNNETTTHFMIGINIIYYPNQFLVAFDSGNDIAVHTWSHPYMTTLSNLQILGQFGWSMQLIHNSTGGRVPKYWRPPYGDADNRVRAIAREVFGLKTILWNQDTADWSLTTGGTNLAKINASMDQWLKGPKTPGLIVLQHELTDVSVQGFTDAYPLMKSAGWKTVSVVELAGNGTYQNARSSSSPVTPAAILLGSNSSIGTTSGSASIQASTSGVAASASNPSSTSIPSTPNGAVPIRSPNKLSWALSTLLGGLLMAAFSALP